MKVLKTPQFDADQTRIEDHVFESNDQRFEFVERFIDDLDSAVEWIRVNATTPKDDEMGDRSWPFYREPQGRFRYRLKYVVESRASAIILKRIIDNREQNLDIYPSHKLDQFSGDDE